MRLGGAGLIAAVLALAGCKATDPKPVGKKEKEPAGLAARPKGTGPAWLDDSLAKLPGAGTGVPKAGSWADPGSPNFDAGKESKGLLAGRVFDPLGKGAKNVFIRIEPVDAAPAEKGGAAIGILTNDAGYFMVKDLPAGRVYTLTAEAKSEGKPLVGVVQTRPPQVNITIALREDAGQPTPAGAATTPADTSPPRAAAATGLPPPAGELIPSTGTTRPAPAAPADGGWAPGTGATAAPIPATIPGPASPAPAPVPVPPLDPRPAVRPESTAGTDPPPWKPPAASIPGGPPVPSLPLPPPGTPAPPGIPPPPKMSSRPVRPGANFTLVDTLERPWEFATGRSPLVLLDFITTNCPHCTRTAPVLTDLQARYAAGGLQLVGVLCDDGSQHERAARAAKYQRDHHLNYAVYVEPGPEPGAVRDRFLRPADGYPTAVLLDSAGNVVWQGHPGKKAELESAIRRRLGR